jgi:methionyl-tRNA synthetase
MNWLLFTAFINRVVVLTKYYEGLCQAQTRFQSRWSNFNELKAYPAVISSSIENTVLEALGELMNVARLGNKYLADEEERKMIRQMQVAYKHKCMWH